MNRARFVVGLTLVVGLGSPVPTFAQCLPDAERATFERVFRNRLRQSDWPDDEIYHHALNRLGLGQNPNRAGAWDPSRSDPLGALVTRVADSLAAAAGRRTTVLRTLSEVEDPNRRAPDSKRVFRFANRSMNAAYTAQIEATRAIAAARDAVSEATTPAEREAAEAALALAQRTRNRIANDLRSSAQAQRVVYLTSSGNVGIGDVLAEFWQNHFNVDGRKSLWSTSDYQRVLRSKQCGTFAELLEASAKHPAMLIYLDNFRSRVNRINENYGRELLELHTLGDDTFRFYSQDDVVDAAKALTGWGVQFAEPTPGNHTARFGFFSTGHSREELTMFDDSPQGIPLTLAPINGANGAPTAAAVQRGEQLIRYLAGHPSTRRNICRKLSRWILGFSRQDIVDGCAANGVWGAEGDLGAVYRYLLTRRDFFHSVAGLTEEAQQNVRSTFLAKEKTPVELVTSAYRAVGPRNPQIYDLRTIRAQIRAMASLGVAPAQFPPPTGYDDANVWLSPGLLMRYNAFLHQDVRIDQLELRVGSSTIRGNALETRIRNQVADAQGLPTPGETNAALNTISGDLITDVLKQPQFALRGRRPHRSALTLADTRRGTSEQHPVRTLVHTFLGNPASVRK